MCSRQTFIYHKKKIYRYSIKHNEHYMHHISAQIHLLIKNVDHFIFKYTFLGLSIVSKTLICRFIYLYIYLFNYAKKIILIIYAAKMFLEPNANFLIQKKDNMHDKKCEEMAHTSPLERSN